MTERIRWHHVDGTVVEWFGYVGTVTTPLFQILHPVVKPGEDTMGHRFDEWAICTTFPGSTDQVRYGGLDGGAQDRLKAEAEHWLAEFTASLGAVFPERRICPACYGSGTDSTVNRNDCRTCKGTGDVLRIPDEPVRAINE